MFDALVLQWRVSVDYTEVYIVPHRQSFFWVSIIQDRNKRGTIQVSTKCCFIKVLERERERERETETETETETERQRDRDRQTDRQTENNKHKTKESQHFNPFIASSHKCSGLKKKCEQKSLQRKICQGLYKSSLNTVRFAANPS